MLGWSFRSLCTVWAVLCLWASAAHADPVSLSAAPTPSQRSVNPSQPSTGGPAWESLTAAEQAALRPLQRHWADIDDQHKQRWLRMAERFPGMSAQRQDRVQSRMSGWARLTPQQREQARLRFQEAKRIARGDQKARWKAYKALSPEQRRQLAARASRADTPNSKRHPYPLAGGGNTQRSDTPVSEPVRVKSNLVPSTSLATPPTSVAPSVVQAQPGATTTLLSEQPAPPAHQQTGLPKIAATPGFVDKATLLPQRGAQGAATLPAESSTPAERR